MDARFCSNCGQALSGPAEERRVVTVLFADLVGFTALSEHRDPEAVKRVVDGAFERLVRDVTTFGGRVDKILGDAIVALFGAPVAHEDDAERAVRAALRMQETLRAYGSEAGIDIRMRVGVNTGEVLVGSLRAGGDYTAMGDVVNLASRLQTAASPGEIVVGDATHAATEGAVSYEERGLLTARGRQQTERVWAATGALRLPGRTRGSALTKMVGRESELNVLLNAARGSINHGRTQVVLLIGEAGVGKTRLAQELADILETEDGLDVHEGRCLPYGEVNPWWPIAEVLRGALGLEAGEALEQALAVTTESVQQALGDDPVEVAAVVDGLLHIMGHEGALRGLDGTAARAEASGALLSFLEARVDQSPLLVRIADLHWADDAVFELIDEVCTRLARKPLVLVATARRSLQSRWTPRAGRFNSLLLNVDPLDRDSVATLLAQLTDGDLDEHSADLLLDRSGGNPFYLEELVTLVQSGGKDAGADDSVPLPETLRGLVAARIDALSPEEQDVLGDASIWGTEGAAMVLDRIADAARGIPSVATSVASLAEKDVLLLNDDHWSFRSDLVREVTYARLTKLARLRGHAGIAEYLDRAVVSSTADEAMVETITRHFGEAASLAAEIGDEAHHRALEKRAIHWLAEAARRAEAGGAWPLAARLHGRMLELGGDVPEVRLTALLGRSRARAERWDQDGALADAEAALELADDLGSPVRRAEALQRVAAANMRRGGWTETDRALAEALDIYDSVGDTAGRAETRRQQGLSMLLRGDHRAAEAPILGALDAFRSVGDRRGEGWAFQSLAWIAFGDGRHERASEYIEASARALGEVGDRGGMQWTNGLDAFLRFAGGDFEGAAALAQEVLVESERRGDRFGAGMMHVVLGGVELWTGHPRVAVASADRALECLDTRTDVVGVEQALVLRGRALAMCGRPQEGFASLQRALEVGRRTSTDFADDVAMLTEVQLGLPGVVLGPDGPSSEVSAADLSLWNVLMGRTAVAESIIAEAPRESAGQLVSLALATAALGRTAEALELAARVDSMMDTTYHDQALASLLLALTDRGVGGSDAVAKARATLAPTEDRAMAALVDLADAVRGGRGGVDATTSIDGARRSLAAVGLTETRWGEVFAVIADRAMN